MLVAGVSGEEDQRSGQRTALCHEGPEESYSERWERRAETEAMDGLKSSVVGTFSQHTNSKPSAQPCQSHNNNNNLLNK